MIVPHLHRLSEIDNFGGIAQLGEHLPCKQGVRSSNLLISISFREEGFGFAESAKPAKLFGMKD